VLEKEKEKLKSRPSFKNIIHAGSDKKVTARAQIRL